MRILRALLIPVFFAMTFNAYACLVPLYASAIEDCPASQQAESREACDVFKTLSAQTHEKLPDPFQYPATAPSTGESTALFNEAQASAGDHVLLSPLSDVLLLTTVLRI